MPGFSPLLHNQPVEVQQRVEQTESISAARGSCNQRFSPCFRKAIPKQNISLVGVSRLNQRWVIESQGTHTLKQISVLPASLESQQSRNKGEIQLRPPSSPPARRAPWKNKQQLPRPPERAAGVWRDPRAIRTFSGSPAHTPQPGFPHFVAPAGHGALCGRRAPPLRQAAPVRETAHGWFCSRRSKAECLSFLSHIGNLWEMPCHILHCSPVI